MNTGQCWNLMTIISQSFPARQQYYLAKAGHLSEYLSRCEPRERGCCVCHECPLRWLQHIHAALLRGRNPSPLTNTPRSLLHSILYNSLTDSANLDHILLFASVDPRMPQAVLVPAALLPRPTPDPFSDTVALNFAGAAARAHFLLLQRRKHLPGSCPPARHSSSLQSRPRSHRHHGLCLPAPCGKSYLHHA